jgi:chromosome segregation ATPase
MKIDELKEQLAQSRERLATLQTEADQAASAAASLKQNLAEAEGLVVLKRQEIDDHERQLALAEQAIREAERNEAAQRYEAAAMQLAEAITNLLSSLTLYERAEDEVSAFEPGPRPTKPEVLQEPWDELLTVVRTRSDEEFADELVEAAARSRMPDVINSLPAHLREAARARIQAQRRARQDA